MNIALGLLNLSMSTDPTGDQHLMVELATRHGYRITNILRIDSATFMPTALAIETATRAKATAIIAPDLAHLGAAPAALALHYTLITPTRTIQASGGWSPYR